LTRQVPAAGTKRCAHREFFAPRKATRKLKIRHIRARDQKHASYGREQHSQKVSVFAYRKFQEQLCGNLTPSI
jgi:hypothetical protein